MTCTSKTSLRRCPWRRSLPSDLGTHSLRAPGRPGRFELLLPWAALNEVLTALRSSGDRVRIVRDGRRVPVEEYLWQPRHAMGSRLRLHAVHRMLSQGATLVVDAIDEMVPAIGALAASFEDVFRARVGVNVYAGFRRQHGFDLHWDDHDTVILQVAGRKAWRVFAPTRLHPLREDVAAAPAPSSAATPSWEGLLEDGTLLYMPRGWWHVATPVDEPSLHLTFGLYHQTGADLLDWIATRARAHVEARQDLPHLSDPERQRAYIVELGERLRTLLAATSIDDYLTWQETHLPVRSTFTLPCVEPALQAAAHEHTTVRLTGVRRLWLRESRLGELVFELAGETWRCDPALRPALLTLSGRPRRLSDVFASVPDAQRHALKTLLGVLAASGELAYSADDHVDPGAAQCPEPARLKTGPTILLQGQAISGTPD